MRIARLRDGNTIRPVIVNQQQVVDVGELAPDTRQLIADFDALRPALEKAATDAADARPLDEAALAAPVMPGKLLMLAGNYPAHIAEGGGTPPTPDQRVTPHFFIKPQTTIVGPRDQIRIVPRNVFLDYECELAVVIGRTGRDIPADHALEYVFGYTVINDVSERRLNHVESCDKRNADHFFDWLTGKWFDTAAPMGPVILTADELADPTAAFLQTKLNGHIVQESSADEMLHSVGQLIEYISKITTLEPGDVIGTGTPAGVGSARGSRLDPGDVVECRIDPIGALVNKVTGGYASQ